MSESTDILKSINIISKKIKALPGVKNVIVHEFNKRKISLRGKRIVI